MNTTHGGGPAFPAYEHFIAERKDSKGPVRVITGRPHGGMSLRDYFAAHAPYPPDELLADALDHSTGAGPDAQAQHVARWMARWAHTYADAMLAERTKP